MICPQCGLQKNKRKQKRHKKTLLYTLNVFSCFCCFALFFLKTRKRIIIQTDGVFAFPLQYAARRVPTFIQAPW